MARPMLSYDDAPCHDTLALASGRRVRLVSLAQEKTYLGLIEGYPVRTTNERYIEGVARRGVAGERVHVLPPRRRDWLRTPGDCASAPRLRGEPPEWLPLVTCIAVWESAPTGRTPNTDLSRLAVAWWQDDFAMPIDGAALDAIRALDWDSLAHDRAL